ncbi:NAD-dependent protein deacylase Sirt4 [Daktulosphaira vitifoliae]|uniref:NAD-dependent protein deacylase Sirt4 n=1 Tax=Daktulosphaira vitifoliae TaxID=58002 RepID=UPI0021A9A70D|nr:NAD-dependent protein deacylase Sirt4 [Daktulosphaira vitifoliae]
MVYISLLNIFSCYVFIKNIITKNGTKKIIRYKSNFVPEHNLVKLIDVDKLSNFIKHHNKILVLTGAGISTESGIPDYRSIGVGLYATSKSRPIVFQEFVKNEDVRIRYWARNFAGWPRFSSTLPNFGHIFLKKLEESGKIIHIITQNVDNLHSKAGSKNVLELHGTSYVVHCLKCDYSINRHKFQDVLSSLNPEVPIKELYNLRPDGDVELILEQISQFKVPKCPKCENNFLIPQIVFFGDNIPKKQILKVNDLIEDCDSLLVIGSSLFVYSGYRIVLEIKSYKKPIAIINIGPTRADDDADIKVEAKFGDILPLISKKLNELN